MEHQIRPIKETPLQISLLEQDQIKVQKSLYFEVDLTDIAQQFPEDEWEKRDDAIDAYWVTETKSLQKQANNFISPELSHSLVGVTVEIKTLDLRDIKNVKAELIFAAFIDTQRQAWASEISLFFEALAE